MYKTKITQWNLWKYSKAGALKRARSPNRSFGDNAASVEDDNREICTFDTTANQSLTFNPQRSMTSLPNPILSPMGINDRIDLALRCVAECCD